jgi:hypothetical protein
MYAEATIDERADLPKKVIIFVDELNKYAPQGVERVSLRSRAKGRCAARGRSSVWCWCRLHNSSRESTDKWLATAARK